MPRANPLARYSAGHLKDAVETLEWALGAAVEVANGDLKRPIEKINEALRFAMEGAASLERVRNHLADSRNCPRCGGMDVTDLVDDGKNLYGQCDACGEQFPMGPSRGTSRTFHVQEATKETRKKVKKAKRLDEEAQALVLELQAAEACEECDHKGWLHMNDPQEIQRCDTCKIFDDDDQAKQVHDWQCGCDWPNLDL